MYDWTKWLDHVTDPSNTYTIHDNGNGTYTIALTGTVMQQGTPQDQSHFNNMEEGIVDAHIAAALLLNFARQAGWDKDDILTWIGKVNTVYVGTATLTNTEEFPFHSNPQSVSIGATLDNTHYEVQTKVTAFTGNVGEIVVSDKLTNGFKLACTGSTPSVSVSWVVIPQTAGF